METATQTKACGSCAHWNATSADKGQCRRQPPQAISFKVDDATQFETCFPVTASNDWCGEYEAK